MRAGVDDFRPLDMWKRVYRCPSCKLQVTKIWDKNDKGQGGLLSGTCPCGHRGWEQVSEVKHEFVSVAHQKRKLTTRGK
jgi:hypothetical protein